MNTEQMSLIKTFDSEFIEQIKNQSISITFVFLCAGDKVKENLIVDYAKKCGIDVVDVLYHDMIFETSPNHFNTLTELNIWMKHNVINYIVLSIRYQYITRQEENHQKQIRILKNILDENEGVNMPDIFTFQSHLKSWIVKPMLF